MTVQLDAFPASQPQVRGAMDGAGVSLDIKLASEVRSLLRCPVCHGALDFTGQQVLCVGQCGTHFPIVDGVPILIDERSSVFTIEDCVRQHARYAAGKGRAKRLSRYLPTINRNVKSAQLYDIFAQTLLKRGTNPTVLVIGGNKLGSGMERVLAYPSIKLVDSDVLFGPRTQLICDAHEVPFADDSFDGVIIQAVLEHVADPFRCVEEIHRVLKPDALVYAETPFMQQVHGAGYADFTRFTHLGHRRLFRRFSEIASGTACGPGMALAWSYQYFLLSFAQSRRMRSLIYLFARLTSFYLKYADMYLIDKPGALDAASAYYFIGSKSDQSLSDQQIVKLYRGAL